MNSVHQKRLKNIFVVHWVIFFLSGCISIYIYIFFNVFLAALGLHCCAWAFSVVEGGLLVAESSLIAEHELHGVRSSWGRGLSHCGTQP